MEESFSGKCYRCMRAGHIARECFARKTLDGVMLPLPGEKMSQPRQDMKKGEVDASSSAAEN